MTTTQEWDLLMHYWNRLPKEKRRELRRIAFRDVQSAYLLRVALFVLILFIFIVTPVPLRHKQPILPNHWI